MRNRTKCAGHKALFDTTMPFKPKTERLRTKYQRHSKHKRKGDE